MQQSQSSQENVVYLEVMVSVQTKYCINTIGNFSGICRCGSNINIILSMNYDNGPLFIGKAVTIRDILQCTLKIQRHSGVLNMKYECTVLVLRYSKYIRCLFMTKMYFLIDHHCIV